MRNQSNQTMRGNQRRRGSGFLAAILPTALILAISAGDQLRADILPNPQPLLTNTVSLQVRTDNQVSYRSSIPLSYQATAFKKEPAITGKVLRGVLKFSDEATNDIAFIWLRDTGKLFLDLNHNDDFTDDAHGAFAAELVRPLNYQTFTNVPLSLATSAGRCTLMTDLSFWDTGSRPNCTTGWRSYWQGKMTVAGQDWQVGVMPNVWVSPNGHRSISFEHHLLLRPWDRRNEAIALGGASLDAISLSSFSQRLFFSGHAWQLSLQTTGSENEFQPELKFAEQAVTLGDLKVTGKFVKRLTVQSDGCLVAIDQPAATVKVPVGNYNSANVLLEQAGTKACADTSRGPQKTRVTVTEKMPGTLAVGGPLTNSVAVARHGQDLRMDYRLIGAGGQTYQLANEDRSHPPEFAIFKGDKKIASGNFEFG